jgi:hypothetical protein
MDYFAGLDVSVKDTSVCIVDDSGRIIREVEVKSEPNALLMVQAGPLSQWLFSAEVVHRSNHQHIQSPDPWQNDLKFRPRTRRAVKIESTAQTVRDDVVEDMQAKACTA